MNIIDRMKLVVSALTYRGKTLSGDEWKKGGRWIGVGGNDKGVTSPFRQSTLVYVASSKISENLPQAPLNFYDIRTKQQLGIDSPIVQLFQKPNEHYTYFTWMEEATLYLALYGESYIYMTQSTGQMMGTSTLPAELIVLNPTRLQHVIEDGRLKGWIYDAGTERISISKEEILQIKFPNPYDPIRGFAPIDSAMADVDSDFLAGQYSKYFFINSAAPSIVFTSSDEDESSKEQREEFLREYESLHQGVSKSSKTAILNAGMGITKIGLTQEEMDFVETRKFNAERILSVYGVPPPIAGFYEQATYGNVRTAKRIFWNETIKAYARRWENVINGFFLLRFAPGVFAKFDFSNIDELKHDAKETSELVNVYANHGVPMNVLIDAFELPFGHQEGLDLGYQPMTMLEVGTSFLDVGNNTDSKEMIDVTPKQIVDNTLFNEFSKILHNYLYRQRQKLLVLAGKDMIPDNDFWKVENDRLISKFDPIYAEYGANVESLLKINNFNKKATKHLNSDQIKDLYNKFGKKLGNHNKSRVAMLTEEEITNLTNKTQVG